MIISSNSSGDLNDSIGQNSDLKNNMQPGNFKLQTYGISNQELNDMRMDLSVLDQQYKKWAEEDDSLSGVLNAKITKQKNVDFRAKIDTWKSLNRANERKNAKKRNFEYAAVLRDFFIKQVENFSLDKERALEC